MDEVFTVVTVKERRKSQKTAKNPQQTSEQRTLSTHKPKGTNNKKEHSHHQTTATTWDAFAPVSPLTYNFLCEDLCDD
jgi:hypothetical protein